MTVEQACVHVYVPPRTENRKPMTQDLPSNVHETPEGLVCRMTNIPPGWEWRVNVVQPWQDFSAIMSQSTMFVEVRPPEEKTIMVEIPLVAALDLAAEGWEYVSDETVIAIVVAVTAACMDIVGEEPEDEESYILFIWEGASEADKEAAKEEWPDGCVWGEDICGLQAEFADQFGDYVCTQPPHHDGPHAAYGAVDGPYVVWVNEDE
jgi:hypothetical protein